MSAATKAREALDRVLAKIPPTSPWHEVIGDALDAGPRGTMREWMRARDGEIVYTLQATVLASGTVLPPWTPGPRPVDASRRSTSVSLGGSLRNYAGTRVIAASESVLVIAATFGNDMQVAIYVRDAATPAGIAR